MKKKMKSYLSLLLTLAMVVTMTVPAMAEPTTNGDAQEVEIVNAEEVIETQAEVTEEEIPVIETVQEEQTLESVGSGEAASIKIQASFQQGNCFLMPKQEITVTEGLAATYGYMNDADVVQEGQISTLDVLVASIIAILQTDNSDIINSMLTISDSGWITDVMGAGGSFGYAVNGASPHSEAMADDNNYIGYSIHQATVNADDYVQFFFYQDIGWGDKFAFFEKNNVKVGNIEVNAGEAFELKVRAYPYAYYGSSTDSFRELFTDNITGAQLAFVDTETGDLTDIEGAVSQGGTVSCTISNEGEYVLTAYAPSGTIVPMFLPWLNVKVSKVPTTTLTVPDGATVFMGTKEKHFKSFVEVAAIDTVDNGDGTTTYQYDLKKSTTYNYRVSKADCITYGQKFKATSKDDIVVTEAMLAGNPKTIDRDVTNNNGYNVADLYVNINPQNHLQLNSTGDAYQLVPLRIWQTVDSITNNYFIDPDYHFAVIDENGNASDSVVTVDENGLITAVGTGTAIVLVTYDAITVYDDLYGAIWPENTGVIVVSVGALDAGIDTGMTINETNLEAQKLSGSSVDAEHDVFYYDKNKENGAKYTFTPEEGVAVEIANPTVGEQTVSYTGYQEVQANQDGSYTVTLTEGRNIVKLTKNNVSTYQVLTAKGVGITITSTSEDEIIRPGDTVTVTFDKVYHPATKLSGIYNMSAQLTYILDGGAKVTSSKNQYKFASTAKCQTLTVTIPEDYKGDTYTLAEGKIETSGYGSPYGSHRGITYEVGADPNFNAVMCTASLSKLPDIEIPLEVKVATVTLSETEKTLSVGETATLTAAVIPENATNQAVTWTSSDNQIATVDETGKITAMTEGTATITVASQEDSTIAATCKVTVTKAEITPSVTPEPTVTPEVKANITLNYKSLSLQKGNSTKAVKIKTTAIKGDSIKAAKSSNKSIASVSVKKGVLTIKGKKNGTATITVTSTKGATAKVKITVKKKVNVSKLTRVGKKNVTVKKGKKITLKVTKNPVTATNKITWKSSNKKIATVTKSGKVKGVKKGTVTITAKADNGKKITFKVTVK